MGKVTREIKQDSVLCGIRQNREFSGEKFRGIKETEKLVLYSDYRQDPKLNN